MKRLFVTTKLVAVILTITLVSACTSIPDIKPFADATAALSTALNKGYLHTESQLATLQSENPDLEDEAKNTLEELRKRWKPTKEAMNALVAYTDSLAALADAGKTGAESAKKLTDSFEGLYNAVGKLAPLPGISIGVKTAFEAIAKINGAIARMRARRALKDAAEDAAPAVQVISIVLAENFKELERLSKSAGIAASAAVHHKNQGLIDYHQTLLDNDVRINGILSRINRYFGKPIELHARADKARRENQNGNGNARAAAILASLDADRAQILEQLKRLDPGLPSGLSIRDPNIIKILEARQKELLALSKSYLDERNRIGAQFKGSSDRIVTIDDTTLTGDHLFTKSQEAITAWAKAHADLKLALEKKQAISFREFLTIVKEIVDLYDKEGDKVNGEN